MFNPGTQSGKGMAQFLCSGLIETLNQYAGIGTGFTLATAASGAAKRTLWTQR
jgi:hypothetical protein